MFGEWCVQMAPFFCGTKVSEPATAIGNQAIADSRRVRTQASEEVHS
jgi:hypothetical protein